MKIPRQHPNGPADGGCDCLPRPTSPASPEPPPAPAPLIRFVLRYQDAWFGMEKRVAFEAEDVAAALAMMAREPIGSWAELLQDGEVVCRRGHEPGGAPDYWVVD
jgi:hypothetical protein